MDMQKTAREIGLFETAVNLVAVCNSNDVQAKVGASMPLPDVNIMVNIKSIAEWLVSFGKKKYLFMMPEIALAEEMAKYSDHDTEIIFMIPCDMDLEAKGRLKNNLPNQMKVSVWEEPFSQMISFLETESLLFLVTWLETVPWFLLIPIA